MFQNEIVISGFGGQGVLFAGELLAHSAMDSNLHVTWIPSYGPEMRGGTAHCTIIISDEEIGSPVVRHPQDALIMNLPSLDKYETIVRSGGIMVINSSLVNRAPARKDLQIVLIPASEIAEKVMDKRLANVVMIGAFLAVSSVITVDVVEKALKEVLPKRHHRFLPANFKALESGAAFVKNGHISSP